MRGGRFIPLHSRRSSAAKEGRWIFLLYEHRRFVVCSSPPIEDVSPPSPADLCIERGAPAPVLTTCSRATARGHAVILVDLAQSIGILCRPSTPFRASASFEKPGALTEDQPMEEIPILLLSARALKDNFDVAAVRKDRKLILRSRATGPTVMRARVPMPSGVGTTRGYGRWSPRCRRRCVKRRRRGRVGGREVARGSRGQVVVRNHVAIAAVALCCGAGGVVGGGPFSAFGVVSTCSCSVTSLWRSSRGLGRYQEVEAWTAEDFSLGLVAREVSRPAETSIVDGPLGRRSTASQAAAGLGTQSSWTASRSDRREIQPRVAVAATQQPYVSTAWLFPSRDALFVCATYCNGGSTTS